MVKMASGFPRPENNLKKYGEKYLPDIPQFDEYDTFFKEIFLQIEEIIDENLDFINQTLDIYNDYSYLKREKDTHVGVTMQYDERPDREEYFEKIQYY